MRSLILSPHYLRPRRVSVSGDEPAVCFRPFSRHGISSALCLDASVQRRTLRARPSETLTMERDQIHSPVRTASHLPNQDRRFLSSSTPHPAHLLTLSLWQNISVAQNNISFALFRDTSRSTTFHYLINSIHSSCLNLPFPPPSSIPAKTGLTQRCSGPMTNESTSTPSLYHLCSSVIATSFPLIWRFCILPSGPNVQSYAQTVQELSQTQNQEATLGMADNARTSSP